MAKQVVVLKRDEGESMSVVGCGLKFLCTADKTDRAWSLMETVLPENAGPPPHDHPWDEAYYIVEGEVRFLLGDREQVFKAGDFIYTPGGTLHAFWGASARPARVLVFDAPAHAEALFRDLEREVKEPRDFAKVPEIGQRHHVHFMPPAA